MQSEDQATLLVEYGARVSANFEVAQVYAGHLNDFALELFGTRGSLMWTQERPEELTYGQRDQPLETLRKSAVMSSAAAAMAHYPAGHPEGYPDAILNVIRAFYKGIGGEVSEYPSFYDGHAAALVVAAAFRSHDSGGAWVALD